MPGTSSVQNLPTGTSLTGEDSGYLRIGACEFKIPPEFINVSMATGNTSIPTLRSSSSLMVKHSYATREITVNLVLNGMDQINGYKVDSPFGYPHYVDGLRALLGQFKYTPFVPVINVFLNIQHNIHVVALSNITVETIEGFPETLNVTLTLKEFNATPYNQTPNSLYDQCVNWDLFNFYLQRNIRDKEIGLPLINTPNLTNKTKFKLLKSEALEKKGANLLSDSNYEDTIDCSKMGLHLTKLTFATGNRMPKMQMSYYETPTMQFMGGTDTQFVMQFETTNQAAVGKINSMNSRNLAMVRENKKNSNIGFIKMENELINLTGTTHIALNNITSSTVPGFPGLYTISMSGTSFDLGAKDREKLIPMRPFFGKGDEGSKSWLKGRKGEEKDLLSQTKKGLANRVVQEATIESKLMCVELYPDLRLPKYSSVDWALGKIQKWRDANGLQPLPFTKMPRPKSYIPGRGAEPVEYNGFVDPDFWFCYVFQVANMSVGAVPEKQIATNYANSNISSGSSSGSGSSNSNSIQSVSARNARIMGIETASTNAQSGASQALTGAASTVQSVVAETLNGLLSGAVNPVLSLLPPLPVPDKAVEPEFVPGYEPDQQLRFHWGILERQNADDELIDKLNSWVKVSVTGGGGVNGDGSIPQAGTGEPGDPTKTPKQVSKVTGNPFVDLLINRAKSGCGYVFGASQNGTVCTQSLINSCRRSFSSSGIGGWDAATKWIGKQVWDCSSFVCWGLIQIGLKPSSFKITSGSWDASQGQQLPRNSSDLKVGDLIYGGGHVAVYMGNGRIVHASGHSSGCTFGDLSYWVNRSGDKCKKRCRINGLEEACKKFLQQRPDFYLETAGTNSNGGNSSNGANQNNSNNSNSNTNGNTAQTNVGILSVREPYDMPTGTPSGGSTSNTQQGGQDAYTSGEPVLGKFGSQKVSIQLLDKNKKEKSEKDTFDGANADRWDDKIIKYCKPYNLDPNFIKTIMMIESNGNPRCYNNMPKEPCKGLLQVHQRWFPLPDPYDPDQNLKKGTEVLYTYGAYTNPRVGFDKKKWISCFNRGPQKLKEQLAGTNPEHAETLNYYRKFDAFYGRLVANGGKPGSAVTALDNGKVPPASWYTTGGGGTETATSSVDVKVWFEKDKPKELAINIDKLKNPNAGAIHSMIKTAIATSSLGLIGVGTIAATGIAKIASGGKSNSSTSSHIESSYIHQTPKVLTETFVTAQPSSDTLDLPSQEEFGIGMIDSLSDGELNFDRDKVSKIEDFKNKPDGVIEKMFVDTHAYGQRGRLNRAFPSFVILFIDEHQNWCDKKQFWSNYYLYQSVLEIDVHEAYDMPISTAKVVLTNTSKNIRNYKPKSLTDAIENDSEMKNYNKNAYKWFGSIINEEVTSDMIKMRNDIEDSLFIREGLRLHIRLGYGSNPSNYAPTFSGTISEVMDDGDLVTVAAQSDGAELVANLVADRTNSTNADIGLPREPSDIVAAILCDRQNEFAYQLSGGRTFIENSYGLMHFGFYSSGDNGKKPWLDGGTFRLDALEYDISKNIYKANYRGEYIYEKNKVVSKDGEKNMRFFCYNKTPWDVMKMCEKMNTEFVAYPRPFGMEHRMFFGLPWWQHKYRYERDDKNNCVYEMSKSFAQVNPLNSYQDIIENRMRIDTTKLTTNVIGIYSLGGDLASTPVIMSDSYIDRDKHSTKTIDTTSVQEFAGVPSIIEKALQWSGAHDNGKSNAINVCISELIDSWRNTYAGELIVLGAPDVRAWNYMAIKDSYVGMSGVCQVREVVHSLSGDRGFTTTIVPGMLACNSMKQSSAPNVFKSIMQMTNTMDAYVIGHFEQMRAIDSIGPVLSACAFGGGVMKYGKPAFNFIFGRGANIIAWARAGQIFAKLGTIISTAMAFVESTAIGSAIVTGISSILGFIGITAAGVGAIVAGAIAIGAIFVISSLINGLITKITDNWKYNHCINIYPMFLEDRPWVGGATGQKKLYPDKDEEGEG